MRYIYNIKDEQGKEEEYKAMSYKKLLKQFNSCMSSYPNTSTTLFPMRMLSVSSIDLYIKALTVMSF